MQVVIVEREGAVLGVNLGRPIVTNGDFATRFFPNYFGQHLFYYFIIYARTAARQLCTYRELMVVSLRIVDQRMTGN